MTSNEIRINAPWRKNGAVSGKNVFEVIRQGRHKVEASSLREAKAIADSLFGGKQRFSKLVQAEQKDGQPTGRVRFVYMLSVSRN